MFNNNNIKTGPDKNLLDATALLVGEDPEDLLDELCEQVGNDLIDYRRLKDKALPIMVKHQLRALYHKRMAVEEEIQEQCKKDSKKILTYAGYGIAIGLVVMYFLSLF